MCIDCPHLFYTFLILFSQGQPPLDLPPDWEDCLLGQQIQAAERLMISMPRQGHAKCHFPLLFFLQQDELNSFPHNPPMEEPRTRLSALKPECLSVLLYSFSHLYHGRAYLCMYVTCMCVLCVHACGVSSSRARTAVFIALSPMPSACLVFNDMCSVNQ